MMQEGRYYGAVSGNGGTSETDKGTPFIYVNLNVTHFWDGSDWVALEQITAREITLYLSDKAWPYTEPKLRGLGFNGNFETPNFSGECLNGVELNCKHGVSNSGKTFEEWELAAWSGQGREHAPLQKKDTLRKLSALWRQSEAAAAKPAGGPPAVSVPPPVTPQPVSSAPSEENTVKEEEIPF